MAFSAKVVMASGPPAHILDAQSVVDTLQRLEARIGERFPDSGLRRVCRQLTETARQTESKVAALWRPFIGLRILIALVAVGGLAGIAYFISRVNWFQISQRADPLSLTQALDSMVSLLILAGGAIWFGITLEQRVKRRRSLAGLHRLRSFAHVIDMHQLTKDPTVLLAPEAGTPSSPERRMTEFQLARYLDYCAEMLALTAKLAALYAERTGDAQTMATVNDLEDLASNLGRKIWQKIMILSQLDEHRGKR